MAFQEDGEEGEERRLKVKLGELRISSAERYILSYRSATPFLKNYSSTRA
jgi:hypothetical protein